MPELDFLRLARLDLAELVQLWVPIDNPTCLYLHNQRHEHRTDSANIVTPGQRAIG